MSGQKTEMRSSWLPHNNNPSGSKAVHAVFTSTIVRFSDEKEMPSFLTVLPESSSRTASAPPKSDTAEKTPEPEPDYTDFFIQANKDLMKTEYHRGISVDTLNRFKVGFIEHWRHPKASSAPESPRLIIPTSEHSYLARDTRASLTDIQKKYSKSKVGKTHIFNIAALETASKPIFIVEGEIDALSIIDVGGEAIGLGSVTMIKSFIRTVTEKKPKQPFIIALDNDKAGIKNITELAESFKKLSCDYCISADFNGHKDANEALVKNKEKFNYQIHSLCDTIIRNYNKKLQDAEM